MVAPLQPSAPGRAGAKAPGVLECAVNVSEGRDKGLLRLLADSCRGALADLHSDADHNRSVFTLVGPPREVEQAAHRLARAAVGSLDLRRHSGVHPRFGVLDVVPWVGLEGWPLRDAAEGSAMARAAERARRSFASWAAAELGLPVFLYGPERSLPELRRRAWKDLVPDLGPSAPHPTAGSVAVGLRPLLVAYNLWMRVDVTEAVAKSLAAGLRSPDVRALALRVGGRYQVSCNLIAPFATGPASVYDRVARLAPVERAEVVGLVPQGVLASVPEDRWPELGLSEGLTIESRLSRRGVAAWALEPIEL
jgi:glutamate formiminotransferase